jgi:RimJ/RimL family protein N-acetyltransferase
VNDPEARKHAVNSERIAMPEHIKWFAEKLAATECSLFVMQAGNLPVGQIRFDCTADEARIDYSIDCLFRGRGWAKHLVALGMQKMQEREPIVFRAEVKKSNFLSSEVFKRLGFVETQSSVHGLRTFIFDPSIHRSGIAI